MQYLHLLCTANGEVLRWHIDNHRIATPKQIKLVMNFADDLEKGAHFVVVPLEGSESSSNYSVLSNMAKVRDAEIGRILDDFVCDLLSAAIKGRDATRIPRQ